MNKRPQVDFILTTHFLELCKRLDNVDGMRNCHMEINDGGKSSSLEFTYTYTYKIREGISEIKGAVKVLSELAYPSEIIKNAKNIINEVDI